MSEYMHLINNYLCNNPTIGNVGFSFLSVGELEEVLKHLNECESPDMYAKIGNKVYIIEHFRFDGSNYNRKGLEGIKEETQLEKRLEKQSEYNDSDEDYWNTDKANYAVSKKNLQTNFERCFNNHYMKIDHYMNNLMEKGVIEPGDFVSICFWAENEYPPYFNIGERFKGELLYFFTKQFYNCFLNAEKVDYMLFGCYYKGKRQIFYIDKGSVIPLEKQIDLKREDVNFSSINGVEVTISGLYKSELKRDGRINNV